MSASFSVARVSRDDEAKLPQIRHGWHRREYGEGGGGSGLRETAADESRKETADRVAKYQTYYVGRTRLCYSVKGAFAVLCFCCVSLSLSIVFCLCFVKNIFSFDFLFGCHFRSILLSLHGLLR